ncbi:MAG TPA: hypothetical protein VIW74_10445, partial [Pyrinomonadaceae bacterium]
GFCAVTADARMASRTGMQQSRRAWVIMGPPVSFSQSVYARMLVPANFNVKVLVVFANFR